VAATSKCQVPEKFKLPSLSTQLEWKVHFKELEVYLKMAGQFKLPNNDRREGKMQTRSKGCKTN